jgi:hypothetical protein
MFSTARQVNSQIMITLIRYYHGVPVVPRFFEQVFDSLLKEPVA